MRLNLKFLAVVMAGLMVVGAGVAGEATEGGGVYGAYAASKEWTPPKDPPVIKKLQAWQDQKLGIMITWGLYSQWGIVESWSLVTTRHEWNKRPEQYARLDDRAYKQVYENLITTFNPTGYEAGKWAVGNGWWAGRRINVPPRWGSR